METIEKEHGRIENRKIWALTTNPATIGFYGASQIVRIHRRFQEVKTGKVTEETSLAITSINPTSSVEENAKKLLGANRGHWCIENGSHYTRDRSYDEDRCQVRDPNSAHILATLRTLARFLTKRGVHGTSTKHRKSVPSLHRFCNAHCIKTIRWLMTQNPGL